MRDLLEAEGLSTWPKLTGGSPSQNQSFMTRRTAMRCGSSGSSRNAIRTTTYSLRREVGEVGYSSTISETVAARPQSGRIRRAREGCPIAAPATWSRIEAGIRPDAFTMKSPFRARN